MKITVRQLRNLIKEEVQHSLFESYLEDEVRNRVIKRGGGRDGTEATDSNSLYLWTDEGDWEFIGPPRTSGGPKLPPMSPKAQQAQLKLLQSLAPGETTEVPQYDIVLPRNNALSPDSPPSSDRRHGDFESMRSSLPTQYRY